MSRATEDRLYPEHAKVRLYKDHAAVIGRFLEWAFREREPRLEFCVEAGARHDGRVMEPDPAANNIERVMAEYFGIDLKRVADEKDLMVERMREALDAKKSDDAVGGRRPEQRAPAVRAGPDGPDNDP